MKKMISVIIISSILLITSLVMFGINLSLLNSISNGGGQTSLNDAIAQGTANVFVIIFMLIFTIVGVVTSFVSIVVDFIALIKKTGKVVTIIFLIGSLICFILQFIPLILVNYA